MADPEKQKEEKPKKSFLKWIILALLIVLIGVGGFIAYKMFLAPKPAEFPSVQNATDSSAPAADQAISSGPQNAKVVTLPTFLVNLADPLGRRYLKLTMDVEVKNEIIEQELQTNMSKIRDAVILLLSSKSYADLASLESKQLLKMELVKELNLKLGGPKVLRVYFTEMVIQ